MIWKYTTAERNIVVSEDGNRSGLASALVQEGDTVLEADPPPKQEVTVDPRDAKIAELQTRIEMLEKRK